MIGCNCLELFVGLVGDEIVGESVVVVVGWELEEEIGYCVDCIEDFGVFYFLLGMIFECFILVCVLGLMKVGNGGGDGIENIIVYCVVLMDVVVFVVVKCVEGVVVDVKMLLILVMLIV